MRRRHLPAAALLGLAVAVLPAVASSEPPSISAYNEPGLYGGHSWMPATATVGAGGVVKFANPYSSTYHGLKFTGGSAGATPSCTGIPAAAGEVTGAVSWQGECTFSAPGTYTFICTVHPSEMQGTITVNPNGTTTTTTTTTTTPTSTTPTTTPSAPGEPSSGAPLARGLSLRSSQRGGSVKGTLDIAKAQAGGRLEIDVLTKSASLASVGHAARVRVGRLVRGSLSPGRLSFAVKLNARARSALRRHRRLALTVKITLTPLAGTPTRMTRGVVLRG
jgi:plastocyanin